MSFFSFLDVPKIYLSLLPYSCYKGSPKRITNYWIQKGINYCISEPRFEFGWADRRIHGWVYWLCSRFWFWGLQASHSTYARPGTFVSYEGKPIFFWFFNHHIAMIGNKLNSPIIKFVILSIVMISLWQGSILSLLTPKLLRTRTFCTFCSVILLFSSQIKMNQSK